MIQHNRIALATLLLTAWLHAPVWAGNGPDVTTLRTLAEGGDVASQLSLGHAYMAGDGVEIDYIMAGVWFRSAAKQGNAAAQEALGTMYMKGRGVPLNGTLAYVWLSLAAGQGSESALALRDDISRKIPLSALHAAQSVLMEHWAKYVQPFQKR